MNGFGKGLGMKITLCVIAGLLVSVVVNLAYFRQGIRQDVFDTVLAKSRSIVYQAESTRDYMSKLRAANAFDEQRLKKEFDSRLANATDKIAAARETTFFKTVPIIAAMWTANEHAAEAGYRLRVPKVQPRNKDNEPDAQELPLLNRLRDEHLSELFTVDSAHGVIRYLRPIKLTRDCLVCHGTVADTAKKDGYDLLGMKAEGWKVGEQHGAFEILTDLAPIEAAINRKMAVSFGITFLVSVITLAFLVWVIRRLVLTPLRHIGDGMQLVAEGDLSSEIAIERDDEIGTLAGSINTAISNMRTVLTGILESSCTVAAAGGKTYAMAEVMATGAEEVAVQAGSVATAGEEMAATSCDIAGNCQMAADSARLATAETQKGAEIIEDSITIMSRISNQVQAISQTVDGLGTRSEQIGAIVSTIEDIADQTNLLALNAAIEAARAGEQGRGFAVVADEVRALAERTTRATHEIGAMIKTIQQETKRAVLAMDEGVREVNNGTEQATQSGEALERILDQINSLSMQVTQIAAAAEEQTATTGEISSNMVRITDVVGSVSVSAQQSSSEAGRLNSAADRLLTSLASFRVKESTALIIEKAKSAHMIYIGKIRAHLHGEQTVDPGALPTHLTCAFGSWYLGKGKEACGHVGLFREVDAPHAMVHELGKKAVVAYNKGEMDAANRFCREMVEQSEMLIRILDRLAAQCGGRG